MATVKQIVDLALSQVGYREGKNNDNKYGISYGFNHAAWCQIFVWWLAHQVGLKDNVDMPKTASCPRGLIWFQERGRLYRTPKVGDYIYFKWTSNHETEASHVGIVVKLEGNRVYTVEGNAGSASDRVIEKSYSKSYACIVGYGRLPLVGEEPAPPADNIDHQAVKELQTALNQSYRLKLSVDGIYGANTKKAVNDHLLSYGKTGKYVKWVQARLTAIGYKGNMLEPDGIFGTRTRAAVRAFQKARRLSVDGVVGNNTICELIKRV